VHFIFRHQLSIDYNATMKLSFSAFFFSMLLQTAHGNYDCSLCEDIRSQSSTVLEASAAFGAQTYCDDGTPSIRGLVRLFYTNKEFLDQGLQNAGLALLPPNIECWDFSGVTCFRETFRSNPNPLVGSVGNNNSYKPAFLDDSPDLNCWDTSDANDMEGMFYNSQFNGSLDTWDTSGVTTMKDMFYHQVEGRGKFDKSLSHFDTEMVTDMSRMFMGTPFNKDIGKWDVSRVSDFSSMFEQSAFNQCLAYWASDMCENTDSMYESSECIEAEATCENMVCNIDSCLGRFEIRHAIGNIGSVNSVDPFQASVYYVTGSNVIGSSLSVEVWGMLDNNDNSVKTECSQGTKLDYTPDASDVVTDTQADVTLDVLTGPESVTNGSLVDVCIRVFHSLGEGVTFFVDTRFQIDMTYTADWNSAVAISDPSLEEVTSNEVQTVTASAFLCDISKEGFNDTPELLQGNGKHNNTL